MGLFNTFFASNADREVDVHQVDDAAKAKSHTLIDVRERFEWNQGHIRGSVLIPLGELSRRASELPVDKPIYTICRSGNRSLTAINILNGAGHTGAKSLAGGIIAWGRAGKKIAR